MSFSLTTLHLYASRNDDVAHAAQLLQDGGLVAFATETVYGLGANALSAQAVAGVFRAKQRPAWDPLIVHLAAADDLQRIAVVPAELAKRVAALAAAFWPGPLTLLLPRNASVPDAVTAGRPLVGVRVPAHPAALALLQAAGVPVAAPSANLFGHTSPTTAEHVLVDLEGAINAVLDAGPTTVGVESTVVDPTQTPMMLYRHGAVSAEQLTAATGVAVVVYQPVSTGKPEALPSPGVGLRHYAPRALLVLVAESEWPPESAGRAGVMLPDGWASPPEAEVFRWGRWDDMEALARGLFAGLRSLDERGVEVILCPLPEPGGLGDAIRDRLQKAAMPA